MDPTGEGSRAVVGTSSERPLPDPTTPISGISRACTGLRLRSPREGDLADVFISYARSTEAVARHIAERLRAAGYDVWWDTELPTHRAYYEVIEERLAEAK